MSESEVLRSALFEVEFSRSREARSKKENELLLAILRHEHSDLDPDEAIGVTLAAIRDALEADASIVLSVDRVSGTARIGYATHPELVGVSWYSGAEPFSKLRVIADVSLVPTRVDWPSKIMCFRSWVSTTIGQSAEAFTVLACVSHNKGAAGPLEVQLFKRAAAAFSQTIQHTRLRLQNIALAGALSGGRAQSEFVVARNLDPGFEAINSAFHRLAEAQDLIVQILADLLSVKSEEIDEAVQRSLDRMGNLLRLQRVCLLKLNADGDFECAYLWHGDGADHLFGEAEFKSAARLFDHYPLLKEGQPCYISDGFASEESDAAARPTQRGPCGRVLGVPILRESSIFGIATFTSSSGEREFLTGEINLLRSLASVVGSLLVRKAVEAAIADSQVELYRQSCKLRTTLDALPDLVVELDQDRRMTSFYSDRMSALVDNPGSYIGSRAEDVLPRSAAAKINAVLHHVEASGQTSDVVFFLRLKRQGHWFNVSISRRPMERNEGKCGYLAVIRDVTREHKQIEEIERLGSIVRRTSNLVIITNANREIVWVNEAFEKRSGYALDEVVGRRPGEVLQGDLSDPRTVEAMRTAFSRRSAIQCEILNYDRSGQPYWVDMDIHPTWDTSGELSGYMAVQTDITERKVRLDQLERSERQARADLAAATDASRDGIAVTDADGLFVYMNSAHQEMFGISSEHLIIGQHWSVLYSAEKLAFLQNHAFPVLQSRGAWKGEIAGLRFDGSTIEQEVSLTLKSDGGIVCITRDIAERLFAESERTHLQEALQLAQRREALSQVAAGLAHDFNNLIASISGSATLIERASEGGSNEHARRILLATQRASELVHRLLAQGARVPDRQLLSLSERIAEAADLLRAGLRSGTRLILNLPDPDLELEADPTDVLQILLNLGVNARDALPDGLERPEISLSARTALPGDMSGKPVVGSLVGGIDYAVLEVSDNGMGMDAGLCDQVFQPYFTTKGDGGSGLGLAIVSSIVDANSGAIFVVSSPGSGTTIKIMWPMTSIARSSSIADADMLPVVAQLENWSVLLVDDNEDVLDVLTVFFEKAGAEVAAVSDPEVALEALQEAPEAWDLLITDFDMPTMTGAELARRAKNLRRDLPIILMTGYPDWRSRTSVGSDKLFELIVGKRIAPDRLITLASSILGKACYDQSE